MTSDDFYALLSEATGASPKQDGPVPGFYDALGAALTIQQTEELQAMQAATADLFSPEAESVVPMSLQRTVGAGMIQGAGALRSMAVRPFDGEFADDINRGIGAMEAGLREDGSFVGDSARGAVSSIVTMAPGIPAGAPGVIGMATASSANQALTTGKDAGLEGPALYSYVGTTAAIEGIVISAFQRFGLGGLESAATKEAVLKGIAQPLKYVAKNIGAELPEEIIIQVGQNVNDYLYSVTPEMDLGEGLVDVIGQTVIAAGAMSGARVGQNALRQYEQGREDIQGALRGRTEGYQAPTATEAPTEPPAVPVEEDTEQAPVEQSRPTTIDEIAEGQVEQPVSVPYTLPAAQTEPVAAEAQPTPEPAAPEFDLAEPILRKIANAESSSRKAFEAALGGRADYNELFGVGGKYDNKATREAILAKARAMAPAPAAETPDVTGTGWTIETAEGVTQLVADDGMTVRNFDTPQEAAQYAKANPFVEEGDTSELGRATALLPEVDDAPAESMAVDIPVGKYIDDYKKKGKGTRGRRKVQAEAPQRPTEAELKTASRKVSAHGLDKGQEAFLTKSIRDGWDDLPVTPGQVDNNTRPLVIEVPGDGTFTITNQRAANAIHYRVTGKYIKQPAKGEKSPLPGRNMPPKVTVAPEKAFDAYGRKIKRFSPAELESQEAQSLADALGVTLDEATRLMRPREVRPDAPTPRPVRTLKGAEKRLQKAKDDYAIHGLRPNAPAKYLQELEAAQRAYDEAAGKAQDAPANAAEEDAGSPTPGGQFERRVGRDMKKPDVRTPDPDDKGEVDLFYDNEGWGRFTEALRKKLGVSRNSPLAKALDDADVADVYRLFANTGAKMAIDKSGPERAGWIDVTDYDIQSAVNALSASDIRSFIEGDQGIPIKHDPPSAITKPFEGPSQVRRREPTTYKRTPERPKPVAPYRVLFAEEAKGAKPIAAPDVIAKMQKVLDLLSGTVSKVGGYPFRRQGYAAVYRRRQNVIRLGRANDIDRMAHEMAHAIEPALTGAAQNPWTSERIGRPAAQELIELGRALYGDTIPTAGYGSEGFAEFMYYWITQPHVAREAAPVFHQYFVQNILTGDAKLKKALEAAQDAAVRWEAQGVRERGRQTVYDPGSAIERVKRARAAVKAFRESFVERWWNAGDALYAFTQQAEKTLGRKLKSGQNPFRVYETLNMQAAARATEMQENGVYLYLKGSRKRFTRSLDDMGDILRKNKIDEETFGIYLVSRRAKALYEDPRGERDPGMSRQDAEMNVAKIEYEHPEIVRAAEIAYEWNDGILQYWAAASERNQRAYEAIKLADPGYYVPLAREFDAYTEAASRYAGGGPKRLKGSGRRVKMPVAVMIANAQSMVAAAHKEKLVDTVLDLADAPGVGKWVERVETPVHAATTVDALNAFKTSLRALAKENTPAAKKAREILKDPAVVDALASAQIPIMTASSKPGEGTPYIVRFEDGKPVWYEVQPGMMQLLGSMELKDVNIFLRGMQSLASISRAGMTTANAGFNLVTNLQRDLRTMLSNISAAPDVALAYWSVAMKDLAVWRATGKRSEMVDLSKQLGIDMATSLGIDAPHTRRVARRASGGRGLIGSVIERDPKGVFRAIITAPGRAWDAYRDVISTPEMAPRIAAIQAVADKNNIDLSGELTFDDIVDLTIGMKQVTTDFTGGGTTAKELNRYVTFLNAAIQGIRASAIAAQRNPVKFTLVSAITMTIPAVVQFLAYKDEEWYQEMDPREMFMYDKMKIYDVLVRVPRPFETGGLFAAMVEMGLMGMYKKEPKRALEWAEMFLTAIAPPVLPTAVRIPLEQIYGDGGRNFFFDQPIVPQNLQRLPAEEQYNEYTSRAAKVIGRNMGLSPARIDHVINSMFGSVGRDVLAVTGLGPQLSEREMELADIPIIGRQFKRGGAWGGSHRSVVKMYDTLSEHRTRQNSLENPETKEERRRRLILEDAATAVGSLSLMIRETYESKQREEYAKMRLEIAQEALKRIEDQSSSEKSMQRIANTYSKEKERIQERKKQERLQ